MVKNTEFSDPGGDKIELSKVLRALSDPIRLEIVLKLAKAGQISCGAFQIPMPKSTLSHHFKVLREAGIVANRREGNERINFLRKDDLDKRFPGLLDSIINASESI